MDATLEKVNGLIAQKGAQAQRLDPIRGLSNFLYSSFQCSCLEIFI